MRMKSWCSTHGRIVERGSHWDLLAANGMYARMWRLQQDEDRERGEDKALAAETRLAAFWRHRPPEPLSRARNS